MTRFGTVMVNRVRDSADLKRLLRDPWFKADVFIVKPSWYSPHPGNFTDADTLRILFEALDGRVLVVEGYSMDRQDGGMHFTVGDEEVDWRWVMRHPSWDWIREEGCWDQIRRQDRWFLDKYGFSDLFDEYDIEYVNVTEEVWQGRTADARRVKEAVEAKFAPVFREELYGYVPQRLHELRGATLISFGKVKGIRGTFPSLTMKNLFGLIPDPLRSWWHGPKDRWLARSIVDINKVYASLFNVYGLCEALKCATVNNPQGNVRTPWGAYDILKDLGIVAFSRHLISLDAVLCSLMGIDPERISYLRLGEETFGPYDRRCVEEAKAASTTWFPVRD